MTAPDQTGIQAKISVQPSGRPRMTLLTDSGLGEKCCQTGVVGQNRLFSLSAGAG
jgi:hypothetical protein